MPATLTYPGVYIEELPSGVRTITGVSTSVTAFVGKAKRGPINKAVNILNYSHFERRFGGLDSESFMSYAVRQFFMNGGGEAWVVRLAKDAVAASKTFQNNSNVDVLLVTALDEGKIGNSIEVSIDYDTSNPASTFNLHLDFVDKDNPSIKVTESFSNLSMNSKDSRYVEDIINGVSRLAKVKRVHDLSGLDKGTSISGKLTDVGELVDDTHNQLRISVNGKEPVEIQFSLPADIAGADEAARLATLCDTIKGKVIAAANGDKALKDFTCAAHGNNDQIIITSGEEGETSTIRVLAGLRNDVAARLKLSTVNGGVEEDAAAKIRPREIPHNGVLTSGAVVSANLSGPPAIPSSGNSSFMISIDGLGPDLVDIGTNAASGATVDEKYQDLADRIQQKVRDLKKTHPAFAKYTCTVTSNPRKLVLASGSRGKGSSVLVSEVTGDGLAAGLELLAGIDDAVATQAGNETLEGGNESDFTDSEAYNLYIASRDDRKGLYALEDIDLFNLLCLPGVSDSGILMDADSYCRERRAFLIADAPQKKTSPSDMNKVINGTTLPKSEYGAVYYPWIQIADPLKGGKLKSVPPSGTIAGLYARTDATRGVWKAPAGTDATLNGVQGVDYLLTDPENGTLNPLGVNCVRIFPVYGAIAWGARTLRGADQMTSEYKYIPVRRLALYLEESLYRGLKWVVFEPNDEPLWGQIRLNVGAFMHNLFRQGAFQGVTPKEAYLVKCDSETTTQNDINLGIVNILVGFAPLKPAEFVIIKIQQLAGQIQT